MKHAQLGVTTKETNLIRIIIDQDKPHIVRSAEQVAMAILTVMPPDARGHVINMLTNMGEYDDTQVLVKQSIIKPPSGGRLI